MLPFRAAFRAGSTPARAAANAVANRAGNAAGQLETETWVATEFEEGEGAVFSDPLTIDELSAARASVEEAFASAPAGYESMSDASSVDADQQMERIERSVVPHTPVKEFLDAAVEAARDRSVQNAVMEALFKSPDTLAALERSFAQRGLAVHFEALPAMRPAIAANGAGTSVTVEEYEEAGERNGAQNPLDAVAQKIIGALGAVERSVQVAIQGLVGACRWHFDNIFKRGHATAGTKEGAKEEGEAGTRALAVLGSMVSAACLIVMIALFKRVR